MTAAGQQSLPASSPQLLQLQLAQRPRLHATIRAIFSTRRHHACCGRSHSMGETSEPQESKDFLEELNIEFEKPDAVYYPGERILGKIAITTKAGSILSTNKVQLTLTGTGRLLRNSKREDSTESARREEIVYLRKEITLVDKNTSFSDHVSYITFEERLPANLATSIECRHARVLYTARASLHYHNGTKLTRAIAVHGFSVVERTDLNMCSKTHFEAVPISAHRKFGLCSCIGGQMRCSLNIEKMAFVCGESLSITGRIENRSDRRIEKVSVTIQQILRVREKKRNAEANKEEITWTVDNVDIHEDFLALFVDAGANIKIDRKLHIPPLPPSTPNELEMSAPVHPSSRRNRMSLSHARISHGSEKRDTEKDANRLITISYALAFRVKSSGVDVMAMDVPVIIGSMPLHSTKTEAYNDKIELGEDPMAYKQCKSDKALKLTEDKDSVLKCSQFMLQYVNKYPFFVDLTTSSKQSKKISMLASAIRAEGKLMKNVRAERRLGERLGTVDSGETDTGHSSVDMSVHRSSYINEDFNEDEEDLHKVILVRKGPVMLEVHKLASTTPVMSL